MNKNQLPTLENFKQWALQSGFPFENDILNVIHLLKEQSSEVRRHVPFQARDPEGATHLRSVDFDVSIPRNVKTIPAWNGSNQRIHFRYFIEAKWMREECLWFVPSHSSDHLTVSALLPRETKNRFGSEGAARTELVRHCAHPAISLPRASAVVKAGELGRDRDSATAAICQIIECFAHFVEHEIQRLGDVHEVTSHYYSDATVFFPVIVTNAALFMLRDDASTKRVSEARDISDLGAPVDIVAVQMPNLFHLHSRMTSLAKLASSRTGKGNAGLAWSEFGIKSPTVYFVRDSALQGFISEQLSAFDRLKLS